MRSVARCTVAGKPARRLALSITLALAEHGKTGGVHAGFFGLVANVAVAVGGSLLMADTATAGDS